MTELVNLDNTNQNENRTYNIENSDVERGVNLDEVESVERNNANNIQSMIGSTQNMIQNTMEEMMRKVRTEVDYEDEEVRESCVFSMSTYYQAMFFKSFENDNFTNGYKYVIYAVIVKAMQLIALGAFLENILYPYSTKSSYAGICNFHITNDISAITAIKITKSIVEHLLCFVFVVICVSFESSIEKREKRLINIMIRNLFNEEPEVFEKKKYIVKKMDLFLGILSVPFCIVILWMSLSNYYSLSFNTGDPYPYNILSTIINILFIFPIIGYLVVIWGPRKDYNVIFIYYIYIILNLFSIWLGWSLYGLAFMSVVIINGAEPSAVIMNGVAITFIGAFDKLVLEYFYNSITRENLENTATIRVKDLTQAEMMYYDYHFYLDNFFFIFCSLYLYINYNPIMKTCDHLQVVNFIQYISLNFYMCLLFSEVASYILCYFYSQNKTKRTLILISELLGGLGVVYMYVLMAQGGFIDNSFNIILYIMGIKVDSQYQVQSI